MLFNGFLNDDFQILGWLKPSSFVDIFKPFIEKEPILFYWRPIVNFVNSLTIYLFGFQPLPFLVQNFFIYILTCFLIFKILKTAEFSYKISLLASILFAVLPSHELTLGWLACRFDLFMTFFILLSVYFYFKIAFNRTDKINLNYLIVFIFILFAIFSKEHSFAIAGLGLLMFYLHPKKIKTHIIFTTFVIISLILYFLLRQLFIGGSPFSSSNFAEINIIDSFFNLLIYIATSLVHPELFLRLKEFGEISPILIIQITIIFIVIALLFYNLNNIRVSKNDIHKDKFFNNKAIKFSLFGFFFYILTVFPVLPLYMRWYGYLPFVGMIFMFFALLSYIDEQLKLVQQKNINDFRIYERNQPDKLIIAQAAEKYPIKIYKLIILLILFYIGLSLVFNINQSKKWNYASGIMKKILNSLAEQQTGELQNLTLWCVPDKIDGINTMKLGVEQTVHYATGNYKLNVKAPLRMETDKNFKVNFQIINDSTFQFYLSGGILKHQFTERTEIDSIFVENEEYVLKIKNRTNGRRKSAQAVLKFNKRTSENSDIFWQGSRFQKF